MCDGLTNWDNVKPSIDLEALGKPDELLLVDQVYTFQQILEYAYTVNLLHDGKAYDLLRNKISAAPSAKQLAQATETLNIKAVRTSLSMACSGQFSHVPPGDTLNSLPEGDKQLLGMTPVIPTNNEPTGTNGTSSDIDTIQCCASC